MVRRISPTTSHNTALMVFLSAVLLAFSSGAPVKAQQQSSTQLNISKKGRKIDNSGIENTNNRDPADATPFQPSGQGNMREGSAGQAWNLGVEFDRSTLTDDDWNPSTPGYDADLIGIFLHKIRRKESITFTCLPSGAPNCPIEPIEWEMVEWVELHFSDYGDSDALSEDLQTGKITITEIFDRHKDESYINDDGDAITVRDAFRPRMRGKGCWALMMAEAYLILPTHPAYAEIRERLEETNVKDKDHNIPIPGEEEFSIGGDFKKRSGGRRTIAWEGGGVIDGSEAVGPNGGDGVEDFVADNGGRTLDDLINRPEQAPPGGTVAGPGSTLGKYPEDLSPPGANPGQIIPAIAEWVFLSWNQCKRKKPRIHTGIGKDSLCNRLVEEDKKSYIYRAIDN